MNSAFHPETESQKLARFVRILLQVVVGLVIFTVVAVVFLALFFIFGFVYPNL